MKNTQAIERRLELVRAALDQGRPIEPLGARLLYDDVLQVDTDRGPFYMRTTALPVAMRPAAPPPPPKPAAERTNAKADPCPWLPLEKTWAWKEDWPAKHRPGTAPKRAVGNWTNAATTAQSIADLRHNLATAKASGCEALVKVMGEALRVALAIQKGDKDGKRLLGRLVMGKKADI